MTENTLLELSRWFAGALLISGLVVSCTALAVITNLNDRSSKLDPQTAIAREDRRTWIGSASLVALAAGTLGLVFDAVLQDELSLLLEILRDPRPL